MILRYIDFVSENNDDLKRSLSGMNKYGMLDKTKFPDELKDYLESNKFIKVSDMAAGVEEAIGDQIYHKRKPKDFEITCFITDDDNNHIGVSLYHNPSTTGFTIYFKWINYNEVIKFIDNYDFQKYINIIEYNLTHDSRLNTIKDTFKGYDSIYSDITTNF